MHPAPSTYTEKNPIGYDKRDNQPELIEEQIALNSNEIGLEPQLIEASLHPNCMHLTLDLVKCTNHHRRALRSYRPGRIDCLQDCQSDAERRLRSSRLLFRREHSYRSRHSISRLSF